MADEILSIPTGSAMLAYLDYEYFESRLWDGDSIEDDEDDEFDEEAWDRYVHTNVEL